MKCTRIHLQRKFGKTVTGDRPRLTTQADGKRCIEVQLDIRIWYVPEHLIGASFSEETILAISWFYFYPKWKLCSLYPEIIQMMRRRKLVSWFFLAGGYQTYLLTFLAERVIFSNGTKTIGGWKNQDGEMSPNRSLQKDNQKNNKI